MWQPVLRWILLHWTALTPCACAACGRKDWYVDEARTAMEQGGCCMQAKYSGPDYELLLAQGCTLSIQNTMIEHAPEVREKLQDLGIAVLEDYSSYRSPPAGPV